MNYKKIANENHEEVTRYTTRTFGKHGLPQTLAKEKRVRNRAAKREEARRVIAEQCNPDSF